MTKTIQFKTARPVSAEQWVRGPGRDPLAAGEASQDPRPAPPDSAEPMKRLTIDVPLSLHIRLKIGCATRGTNIADVVRGFIEREFPLKP
jgi:hypothetical protein